jgi:hypothetical protein
LPRLSNQTVVFVLFVATLAGLAHIAPYWAAQAQVPPGWSFTGNLANSPDFMQYRVWFRQSQTDGIIISNKFTTEPNNPYLLVIFYYVVGQLSLLTGWAPEFVFAYLGSLFAFGLVILLFFTVRQFLTSVYQVWWVFLAILLGGGLGTHLRILGQLKFVQDSSVLKQLIIVPLQVTPVFEFVRGVYVYSTLLDTHHLLNWLASTASVLSLYLALKSFSRIRLLVTAFLYAATTVLHVYEGILLLAITVGIGLLIWRKGLINPSAFIIMWIAALSAAAALAWQAVLYRSSGLPPPSWRGPSGLVSSLLIAYPIAWILIAWGFPAYWQKAGLKECFMLGWALGCVAIVLSAPFYPYPLRGTMTLQIPLYVIAGSIFFARFPRVTWQAALVGILVLGAAPAVLLGQQLVFNRFVTNEPEVFMSADNRGMVNVLRERASPEDVLIVDKSEDPTKTDDLWLAPEYPGKLYCGHFFLTVDYERKCGEVNGFFGSTPVEQAEFLKANKIRYLYVRAAQSPDRFQRVPGLVLLKSASIGSLFEYTGGSAGSLR